MTDCAPLQSEALVGNVIASENQIREEFSPQEGTTSQPQTEQHCHHQVEYNESTAAAAAASQSYARRQFACLYTKHKTQKRKIWKDGRLVVSGCMAALHDADPVPGSGDPTLDQCEIAREQMSAIMTGHVKDLETEKYLVTIEGPWTMPRPLSSVNANNSSTAISRQMTKVISRKFRKPANRIPPPPAANQISASSVLGKRRRPLQPGELQRRYHGNALATIEFGYQQQEEQHALLQRHYQTPAGGPHYDHRQQEQLGPTEQQPPMPQNGLYHQTDGRGTHLPRRELANKLPPAPHYQFAQGNRAVMHHPSSRPEGSSDDLLAFQNDVSRPVQDSRFGVTESAAAAATVPFTSQQPLGASRNEDPYQQAGQQLDGLLPLPPTTMARTTGGDHGNIRIIPRAGPKSNLFVSNNGFDPSSFYGEDDEEEEEDDDGGGGGGEGYSSTSFLPVEQNNCSTSSVDSRERQPVSSEAANEAENSRTLTTSQLLDLFGAGNSTTQRETKEQEATGGNLVSNKPSEKGQEEFELPDDDDSSVDSSQEH